MECEPRSADALVAHDLEHPRCECRDDPQRPDLSVQDDQSLLRRVLCILGRCAERAGEALYVRMRTGYERRDSAWIALLGCADDPLGGPGPSACLSHESGLS